MFVFYATLLSTYFLSLLARIKKNRFNQPNFWITLMVAGILILVSGLRNNIGDTRDYIHLYEIAGYGQVAEGNYETGFIMFLLLLNQITSDPQLMLLITAFITNGLYIWTLRKYSNLFELQTFMYITSGYYLITMNGIRQALVAAVLFASTKYIIEGKFIKYLLVTIIMYTFHISALIMIPVFFLVRQETWSRKTMIVLFFVLIALIFFQPFMSLVFGSIEGTRYASYEEAVNSNGGGANIIRAIIAFIPVVIAYIGRHKLKQEWPESKIFVNMSLINLIVMLFSLYNWLFARFAFYFLPYNFVLLPYMIKSLFKEKQILYFLFVVCYLLFFYYEHVITLSVRYGSNFF